MVDKTLKFKDPLGWFLKMIRFSRRIYLIFLLFIQCLAFSVFLLGFFPLKQTLFGHGMIKNFTLNKHVISQPKKQYDRAIIVLIDALRSDFIYEREQMPFISRQIKEGIAASYIVKAHPPTVTLPRIKVSLDICCFLVMNFQNDFILM